MQKGRFVFFVTLLGFLFVQAYILPSNAAAAPFATLQPGFTQEVYGTAAGFFGGLAFAPDGDVLVDQCLSGRSPLIRFDQQTTVVVNGTTVHPQVAGSPLSSNAGCGLTNHPNGTLYSNLSSGVVNLDANTGTQLLPPFGPAGNALGIAPDPQTGNLVYVGSNGTIFFVNSALNTSGTFSSVTTGNFVDGIFFDPSGNFLFLANRSPILRLTILKRDGSLVQHIPMSAEPDGIAFHAVSPKFVVTNNTNGTMTRFDFPGDDFTKTPVQSVFASGGFRGDLSQVGPDGCLYLAQEGTKFDNGTSSGNNSVVRICPGFVPPPGVAECGDGRLNPGEECDDGNITDGDGCSATCKLEQTRQVCDVDGDSDIDRNDINSIFAARGTAASSPTDPRDFDGNGTITVTDSRACVLKCTKAQCAP